MGPRAFGDTYDLAAFWECGSACGYLVDPGGEPGPCVGLTYDATTETCGTNVFSGANVEVVESETDNGDGSTTVIIEIRSADGSDLVPNNTECVPGDPISVVGVHLGCDVACVSAGRGQRSPCDSPSGGDELDPDLPDPPYELVEAKAVIFGAGGGTLLEFDLNIAGQTVNELGTQFTVGGADQVQITALQFRYVIAVGEPTGACCLSDDSCFDGSTAVECGMSNGMYLGDFSVCPGPVCGGPVNDTCTCVTAATIPDGTTAFDGTGATLDAAAGEPCDPNMAFDLWYFYNASCSGTVRIDTCDDGNGPDTVLEIYDGHTCPPGGTAGCSNDEPLCGIGGLGSSLELPVTFGQGLTVRLGGPGGDVSGMLSVTCVPTLPMGACCSPTTGGCSDTASAEACTGQGGSYRGDGTSCGDGLCTGACCLGDANCAQATLDDCQSTFGGLWQGLDTECGPFCPRFGACCLTAGGCFDGASEFFCEGAYRGDGSRCEGADCTGACCTGAESCADGASAESCNGQGGTFLGAGSECGGFFTFEALSTAAHVETCGSDYDTVLALLESCGSSAVSSNDNCTDGATGGGADPDAACFDPATPGSGQSCTCIPTIPGNIYVLRILTPVGGSPPSGSNTAISITHAASCSNLPPRGACIFADRPCRDGLTAPDCGDQDGQYQGDATSCENIVCGPPKGDLNRNGTVDVGDLAILAACMTGPATALLPDCSCADLSGDGFIDMIDTAMLQLAFDAM